MQYYRLNDKPYFMRVLRGDASFQMFKTVQVCVIMKCGFLLTG